MLSAACDLVIEEEERENDEDLEGDNEIFNDDE